MNKKNGDIEKVLKVILPEALEVDKQDQAFFVEEKGMAKVATRIKSKKFERTIRKISRKEGVRLNSDKIKESQDEIESRAFDEEKPLITTSVRTATSADGDSILYDLADTEGNVVQLSKNDGEAKLVEDKSVTDGVFFRRPDTMLPMAKPQFSDGWKAHLNYLLQYINTDKITFFILLGYLTYIMSQPKDKGLPYPILVIQGHQGTGKSFFCNNIVRALVDPNSNASLRLPKRDQDLAIQLDHTHLGVYDNLRSFSKDTSDLLAQVSTKSGLAPRQHHSFDDLASKTLHGALVLNGIHNFIKEPDLASRCFRVKLKTIPPEDRKPEAQLKAEFSVLLPQIMGALFTLAAKAMAKMDDCRAQSPDRMADFELWLAAVEKVLGMSEGLLQKAYTKNVKSILASGIEDDSLTIALTKLIQSSPNAWKGSPTLLLELLQEYESSYYLPKGPGALTQRLKSQEISLAAVGIHLIFGRDKDRYIIVSAKKLAA